MRPIRFVYLAIFLWAFPATFVLAQVPEANQADEPFGVRKPPSHFLGTRLSKNALSKTRARTDTSLPVQNGPEQVLYQFQGYPDGFYPIGGLIFDASGNLYGTAQYSDNVPSCYSGCGAVFELTPNGTGGWTETTLHSFLGGTDGTQPLAGVAFDKNGNIYGTTEDGGGGSGTLFELSPKIGGGWTETVSYNFTISTPEPQAILFDASGNLFGTTLGVTTSGGCNFCGTVFELTPQSGGGWSETVLHTFQHDGSDGWFPTSGLVLDGAGNLYGTTTYGGQSACSGDEGTFGCGTVFELSPISGGGWNESILYSFQLNGSDGIYPGAGLALDSAGNLYGTTSFGGTGTCQSAPSPPGCGTVFKLAPDGSGGWNEAVLYNFQGGTDGFQPEAALVLDASGNLYGTTYYGGRQGFGTVFELAASGSGAWQETVLYGFQGGTIDGIYANSPLVLDSVSNLYGTTALGPGTGCYGSGCGIVFEVSKEPFVVLPASVSFGNQNVGVPSAPPAPVTLINSGNLPLTITSILVTGANSSEFSQTNNCPSSLAPQITCTISVTFTPSTLGAQNAAITVTDNAPGSSQSVPLTGTGVLPAVTFSPSTLTFGNQTAGSSGALQQTTLTNSGQGTLTITSIAITGPGANQFVDPYHYCPSSLAAGAGCYIELVFNPSSIGNASAFLTVTDNAPGSPHTVPLSGTGVSGVTLSPASVNFPSQYVGTTGLPQNVTFINTGDTTLTITNVTASPSEFAPLSSCGNSVSPGMSCSIGVFFEPATSGQRTGVLTIQDSAVNSPQTIPLGGMGEDFSVAPSSPASATVAPEQTAQYTLAVAPLGGFNQTVTLTCSGAPAMSTCSVSPSLVKLSGSGSTTVMVSVATTGSSAQLSYPSSPSNLQIAAWLAFCGLPGVVLLGGLRKRQRARMLYTLLFLSVLSTAMTWSACGGGSSSSGGGGGTPAGSYNLTVTGAFSSGAANLSHSAKLTLVVQ